VATTVTVSSAIVGGSVSWSGVPGSSTASSGTPQVLEIVAIASPSCVTTRLSPGPRTWMRATTSSGRRVTSIRRT
jgi:hypothetical protein